MSELNEPAAGNGGDREEEEVRRLLEGAGPRPEVPASDLAEIKAAFRAEWQKSLRRRRAPILTDRRLWALAASVLMALGVGWWIWSFNSPAAADPVARVESLAGKVTARSAQGGGPARTSRLQPGEEILAGVELESGGQAALRLAGGPSLRLDAGTRVRLLAAAVIELESGAVYLDTGGREAPEAVAVRTPFGVVTDVGTQFELRLLEAGAAMRVRVREGEVRIVGDVAGEQAEHNATAGTELTLGADGSVTRRRIAAHGTPWSWVLKAAPPLRIEGRTVAELLDEVARETGWTVRYDDKDVAASAGSIVVHGTLDHLTPDQAPAVILPGAGLKHRLEGGTLVVSASEAP